ncbi:MAG: PEGA domain-containing protein [Minicystis sp.]
MCLGWSTAARADQPAALFEDGAELLAQARELWLEGTAAFNRGQLERARLLYLSAFRAQHHWQIAGSLGNVELALGRHRDAAEHIAIYLRESRDLPNADARDRVTLTSQLERAKTKIGVVTVAVEPAGAEILVDGASVGKAPLADPVFVEPGKHVIEAKLDGYQAGLEARELAPGGAVEVKLQLAAVPAPKVEASAAPLAPRQEMPTALPPVRLNKGIIIGGAALSAVALGVGIGLTVSSNSSAAGRDTFRSACVGGDHSSCTQFDNNDQQRWLTGNAAAYSFIGAGIVALATTTYVLVAPRVQQRARLKGMYSPGGAATGLSFSW